MWHFFWLLTHSKPYQLFDEDHRAPHRAQSGKFPESLREDPRWPLVESIFDVGFAPGINSRFQVASELSVRLSELLSAPPPVKPTEILSEQDRLLREFRNRADIQHRQKLQNGIFDASTDMLRKMDKMARERSLAPMSSLLSARLANGAVYFRLGLKLSEGDNMRVDVCHWIRITGTNNSYVEASFGFYR